VIAELGGFDPDLVETEAVEQVARQVGAVAAALGRTVVPPRTTGNGE